MVERQWVRWMGGCKSRAGVRASRRVEIRLTPEEHDTLQRVARKNQQPLAAFVRDVVNDAAAECGEKDIFILGPSR